MLLFKFLLPHIQLAPRLLGVSGLTIILGLAGCVATPKVSEQEQHNASANLIASEQFLATLQNNADYKVSPNGSYYKKLKSGYGCHPSPNSSITVDYQAILATSQKIVDSSIIRGRPETLPLDKMIASWKEIIPMMKEGDSWEIYVHPSQAYGVKGSPPAVPPNAALKFTINLIKTNICDSGFKRL